MRKKNNIKGSTKPEVRSTRLVAKNTKEPKIIPDFLFVTGKGTVANILKQSIAYET